MDKNILNSVFRAYDIRGRIPYELDEGFFVNLGKAYVSLFKPRKVVVGKDMRESSEVFKRALIEGVLSMGCDVVDLGEIATEMMYFAVGEYRDIYDGGFVITPSHNDSNWNGCKIVTKNVNVVAGDSDLNEIKNIIQNNSYLEIPNQKGELSQLDIYPQFKNKILSLITSKNVKPLKIVFDAGNGLGGKIFDYVFESFCLDVEKMYFNPDGSFPNHLSNPAKEENVTELKQRVVDSNADFGIATDADGDRVFFIDKKGRKPDGSYTGVIMAKYLAGRGSNKKIIHDTRIVWPMEKEGKKIGAEVYTCKAGRSYYKEKMEQIGAVFAAESTTHFFYNDFYNMDSGMTTIAHMINMYYEGFDMTKELDYLYETYPSSGEVNYKVDNAEELFHKLENIYSKDGPVINKIDGLSVEFKDWRFNIRRSNTEDLVRLNLEATSKDMVIKKFLELEEIIGVFRENIPSGLVSFLLDRKSI